MKRTDKYRDSYKYDNQYQNHRRRAEEDEFRNRAQSPNKMNGQRSNQRNLMMNQNVTIMVVIIVVNNNLKRKMKNQVELKMAYCYHSYFTYYSSHFCYPYHHESQ